ncbi:MAG: glycosyltransferase family 39 protein [Candidatus Eremiobacteraeota bacterium]|nr:glycosyltransferase family 39 protein [Candidatus Eremiobacteraeota bacterium]
MNGARRAGLIGVVGLGLALCIGAFAILWHLGDKSLTPDEAFYYGESILPIPQLIDFTARANFHPPLFYLVMHFVDSALHWPATAYRYVTAPFGLLTIAATWALARRWFGPIAAAVAALIAATAPLLVSEAHLFRMYGIVTALAVSSWWLLTSAEVAGGWRRRWLWLGYGVLAIAMPYTLYLGSFVVAAQALYGLVRRGALPAAGWAVGSLVALIPWYWAIRIQLPQGGFPGVAVAWWSVAPDTLLFTPPQALDAAPVQIAITLGAIIIVIAGAWLGRRTALPFLFIPVVLQIALSVALHKDLMVTRYLALTVPAFAIASGAVSGALIAARQWIAGVLVAVLVLAGTSASLANYLFVPYYQTTDWYAVEIALHEHAQPADAIVFDQWGPSMVLAASPDVRDHSIYKVSASSGPEAALRWLDGQPDARVWYVENVVESWDPKRLLWHHLQATRPLLYSYSQLHAARANDVLLQLYGPAARKAPL